MGLEIPQPALLGQRVILREEQSNRFFGMIWNRFIISAAIFSAQGPMVSHQNSDAKSSQIISVSVSKRGSALESAVSLDSTFTKDSGRSLAVPLAPTCPHSTRLCV